MIAVNQCFKKKFVTINRATDALGHLSEPINVRIV
jgi:hypothetical protein